MRVPAPSSGTWSANVESSFTCAHAMSRKESGDGFWAESLRRHAENKVQRGKAVARGRDGHRCEEAPRVALQTTPMSCRLRPHREGGAGRTFPAPLRGRRVTAALGDHSHLVGHEVPTGWKGGERLVPSSFRAAQATWPHSFKKKKAPMKSVDLFTG
jgi:hypothetical protein